MGRPKSTSPIINNKPRIFIECFSNQISAEHINNLVCALKSNFYVHSTSSCKTTNWKDILLDSPGRCETGIIIFDKQSITSDKLASFLFILQWRNWLAEDNCHFLLVSTDEIAIDELNQYESWTKLDLALTDLICIKNNENTYINTIIDRIKTKNTQFKKSVIEIKENDLITTIKGHVNDSHLPNIINRFVENVSDQNYLILEQLLAQKLLKTGITGMRNLKECVKLLLVSTDNFVFYTKVFELLSPNLIDIRLAGLIQKLVKKKQDCLISINTTSCQIAKLFICQAYYESYLTDPDDELDNFSFLEITPFIGITSKEILNKTVEILNKEIKVCSIKGAPLFVIFPNSITVDPDLRAKLMELNNTMNTWIKNKGKNTWLFFIFLTDNNSFLPNNQFLQLILKLEEKKEIIESFESVIGVHKKLNRLAMKICMELGESEDEFKLEYQ